MCYYNSVKDKKNLYTPPSGGNKRPRLEAVEGRKKMNREEWVERMNKEYVAKEELLKHCKYSHSALARGYISRKIKGIIVPYKGKYGVGYKVCCPNPDSTRYYIVNYFLVS